MLVLRTSMTLLLSVILLTPFASGMAAASPPLSPEAKAIKDDLLKLARSFAGQGDPDFSKQRQLEVLVDKLLAAAPQPPVRERLALLQGPWKQVWGPYDYGSNGERGVDPESDPDTIHQVVFPGGYYYNVVVLYPTSRKPERVGLLRGVYELDDQDPTFLKVRFTNFPGNTGVPEDISLTQLPALAEQDALPAPTTIVPSLIVKLFFGGGILREVYTDDTLRITFGAEGTDRSRESIYILERVPK